MAQPIQNLGINGKVILNETLNKEGISREEISIVQKAANYVVSTANHIASGSKLRTQEEIDSIFKICMDCPLAELGEQTKENAKSFRCSKCGCSGNTKLSHITNKLARKSENCPIGKWGTQSP